MNLPRRHLLLLTLILILLLAGALLVVGMAAMQELKETVQRHRLQQGLSHLSEQALHRFACSQPAMAQRLATNPLLQQRLEGRADEEHLLLTMEAVRQATGASIIYLMDRTGLVVASTGSGKQNLTGTSYPYRPYFIEAMAGHSTVYPAVGAHTGERGLYVGYPVGSPAQGVVVIKTLTEELDAPLALLPYPVGLATPEGVIFSTNRAEWLHRCLAPLPAATQERLARFRQFGVAPLLPLGIDLLASKVLIGKRLHLVERQVWPDTGWQLIVAQPPEPNLKLSPSQWWTLHGGILLGLLLIGLLVLLVESIRRRAQVEARQRTLMEGSAAALVVLQDGLAVFFNRAALQMTGYTAEEFPQVAPWGLIAPEERERIMDYHKRRIAGEAIAQTYDFIGIAKDGRRAWMRNQSQLSTWNGRPAVLVSMREVTAEKEAEQALRTSEIRYRTLVDACPDPLVVLDRQGLVREFNQAAVQLTGLPASQVLGQAFPADRLLSGSGASWTTALTTTLNGQAPGLLRFSLKTADGRTREVEAHPRPLLSSGQIDGIQIVWRDLTDRLVLEDQLRQAQKMEAVGRLAGGVAHDFNNQLAAIAGCAELIQRQLEAEGRPTDEVRALLRSAMRAKELTSQLLAFARKGGYRRIAYDLHNVINKTVSLFSRTTDPRIRAIVRLDAATPQMLGDPGQLENALLNLLLNARDAMPDGGDLTVTTRDLQADAAQVELSVSDTGIGMDAQTQAHLFEPFFTTKPQGQGTGLGLAAAYGTVTGLGGTIAVVSNPGQGSTFTIRLPVHARTAAVSPETDTGSHPTVGGKGRILVVDDEDLVRSASMGMLEALGYTAVGCRSGQDALDRLAGPEGRFDLIVLDLQMPGVDGVQVLRQLRQRGDTTPVLLVTGHARETQLAHLEGLEVEEILEKPYRLSTLSQVVAARLGRLRKTFNGQG